MSGEFKYLFSEDRIMANQEKQVLQYWDIESYTVPGTFYRVTQYTDKTYRCVCPDYIRRRQYKGEHCKHIKDVIAAKPTPTWRSDSAEAKPLIAAPTPASPNDVADWMA
jgi:predicted nucleic acid-binding Zn finger protein